MELDRTLLGLRLPERRAARGPRRPGRRPDRPLGAPPPSTRDAFLEAGGFDEELFAYWEDVDLVLRLRRAGGRCRLAADARGTHEHSATLGSGSARKNYLIGFGRGYVLRKWGVLAPRRLPAVLARELVARRRARRSIDRNLGGVRGRVRGCGRPRPSEPYPADRRRWRRIATARTSPPTGSPAPAGAAQAVSGAAARRLSERRRELGARSRRRPAAFSASGRRGA